MSGLNIQEMAQNAYQIITSLQQSASDMVGLDALWCRTTPVLNSEDIILAEYTLTQIGLECPKMIKVLTVNSDYNPGNFNIDMFGISYDAPLELHITIETWENVFGKDSMPQQGDVVYVKILHKLFEVKSSEVMYTIASRPTYFKCQCAKYNPTASRMETDEFRQSIDELTTSEAILFGDEISQEVEDTVVPNEVGYQNTTYVDPMKDFDTDCIASEPIIGPTNITISNAFYDMAIAEKPVIYNVNANYYMDSERPHWIFSSWIRNENDVTATEHSVRVLNLFTKDNKYWYFNIAAPTAKLSDGDTVTLMRGNLIKVDGEMYTFPSDCAKKLVMRVKVSEMNKTNRKLTNWWESGQFKIKKDSKINIIKSSNNMFSIDINTTTNTFEVTFGTSFKQFTPKKKLNLQNWNYICFDLCGNSIQAIVYELEDDHLNTKNIRTVEKLNTSYKLAPVSGDFEIDDLMIDSVGKRLHICNIRLYENEYAVGDTYEKDMLSIITKNASKCILVDSPNISNEAKFITPVR